MSFCGVCGDPTNKTPSQTCQTCKIVVHRSCIISSADRIEESEVEWNCVACVNAPSPLCILCETYEPSLYKIPYTRLPKYWLHASCLLTDCEKKEMDEYVECVFCKSKSFSRVSCYSTLNMIFTFIITPSYNKLMTFLQN